MEITRQFLEMHISTMQRQIAAYTGAVEFAQMLLGELTNNGLQPQDNETTVAGPGATATVTQNEVN